LITDHAFSFFFHYVATPLILSCSPFIGYVTLSPLSLFRCCFVIAFSPLYYYFADDAAYHSLMFSLLFSLSFD